MTRDELIAYLRLERHLSLQEIGDLFGLSRQRIAQILDENVEFAEGAAERREDIRRRVNKRKTPA
jgi:transcriptional regulator with XRE-family HTH domain